eukprot:6406606-Prymnesium_polylepis.1
MADQRPKPVDPKPLFALAPPRPSAGGRWLRCQRGGLLSTSDTALLASALDSGVGAPGGRGGHRRERPIGGEPTAAWCSTCRGLLAPFRPPRARVHPSRPPRAR